MQEAFYRKMFVIPEGRTQVIYNGIPLDKIDTYRLSANREVARAELGYKPEDFLVLHIGTVSVRKGQIATAKAIAKLRKKVMTNPNIKVLFVGDLKLNDMEKVSKRHWRFHRNSAFSLAFL